MLLWAGRKTSKASINFFVLRFDFQVHFFIEPFCISLKRTLPPAHPLNQMLKYHCREVIVPNTFGTPSLVDEFRFMDLLFAFGNDGANRLLRDAHEFSTWEVTDFRGNIKVKAPHYLHLFSFRKITKFSFSLCPSVCMSGCLSVCLLISLSVFLLVWLSLPVCLSVCLLICLNICLSVHLTICLTNCRPFGLSVSCISIRTFESSLPEMAYELCLFSSFTRNEDLQTETSCLTFLIVMMVWES